MEDRIIEALEARIAALADENSQLRSQHLEDGTVSLSPYFEVADLDEFKRIWKAAYDPFAHKVSRLPVLLSSRSMQFLAGFGLLLSLSMDLPY